LPLLVVIRGIRTIDVMRNPGEIAGPR
jgi:hypothetical protein